MYILIINDSSPRFPLLTHHTMLEKWVFASHENPPRLVDRVAPRRYKSNVDISDLAEARIIFRLSTIYHNRLPWSVKEG